MVVADTAVVAKRAPRMLHSQQRDPMPIPDVDECDSAAGELPCQAERDTFAGVERLVELVTHLGLNPQLPTMVVNGQPTAVAEPIRHVLSGVCRLPLHTPLLRADDRGHTPLHRHRRRHAAAQRQALPAPRRPRSAKTQAGGRSRKLRIARRVLRTFWKQQRQDQPHGWIEINKPGWSPVAW